MPQLAPDSILYRAGAGGGGVGLRLVSLHIRMSENLW